MKEKLGRFFFLLDDSGDDKENVKETSRNISLNKKSNKSLKVKEILSKNSYKNFKLENIWITSKQPTKRANHYRINYLDRFQNKDRFFLDSYFRDKKEVIQLCFEKAVKKDWTDLVNNYENIKEVEIEFEEKEQGFKTYRKVVSLWTSQGEIIV